MNHPLRLGVFGLRRGLVLARAARSVGLDVVAVCDRNPDRRQAAQDELGAASYSEWQELLDHELDAVVLANDFDRHAPHAIEALGRNRHVLSETAACSTFAEAVRLVRSAEASSCVYALAENYPFKDHVLELRRLLQSGVLGEVVYGEAEYTHGWSDELLAAIRSPADHWRARISVLTYSTHAIAPLMYVTDLWPVEVTGFLLGEGADPTPTAAVRSTRAGLMVIRLDNGALVKVLVGFLQGEQEPETSWVRVHGTRALAENLRAGDSRVVRIRQEGWVSPGGHATEEHLPGTPPAPVEAGRRLDAERLMRDFASAVAGSFRPAFDIHRGVTASLVGICAVRSAALGSIPISVPDIRSEAARIAIEDDETTTLEGHEPTGRSRGRTGRR